MSFGTFSANPKTEWLTEFGEDRNMLLLEDFFYTDPDGRQWIAARNTIINGASIPVALWSSVGSPYTGDYRRASIVHDAACQKPEINRDEADTMFYFACLAGGCSQIKSKILYAGVRIGSSISSDITLTQNTKAHRLPGEHSKEELVIRAKFTILEARLLASGNNFAEIRKIVDDELRR